jgi:hypothetical protein
MKSCTTTSVPVIALDEPDRALVRSTPSTTKRFSEPEAPSIIRPPPREMLLVPGMLLRTLSRPRPFGMRSICAASRLAVVALALVSMSGDSAVTVTDSDTPASFRVRSTGSCLPSWS